jgi:hypothetical protein
MIVKMSLRPAPGSVHVNPLRCWVMYSKVNFIWPLALYFCAETWVSQPKGREIQEAWQQCNYCKRDCKSHE